MKTVSLFRAMVISVPLLVTACPATAQVDYPRKSITLIVPSSPATGSDILARRLGQKLSEKWKVPVIVDNRSGASGNIAFNAAAKSPPDGYTLLVTGDIIIRNRSLYKDVPFDPIKDFVPIAPLTAGAMALVRHPSVNATSVKALINLLKESPGKYNYASPGNGTPHHMAMELFKLATGVAVTHIPYKTTGAIMPDLFSGQIAVMFLPLQVALPLAAGNKINILSAGGNHRAATTPNLPSLAEAAGIQNIDVDTWYAMYAPAGTPQLIVAKLNTELNALLKEPDVKDSLAKVGLVVTGGTQQELAHMTSSDLERWSRVVQEAKIKAD